MASSFLRLEKEPDDETAVVAVDVEGIRSARPGVEKVDVNEHREMSGTVPADCVDVSPRALSAADIVGWPSSATTPRSGGREQVARQTPRLGIPCME